MNEVYLDQPLEVSIETFAHCNARCTFCPYPTLERQGTRMPDALIERLIEEMAAFRHPFLFSPFKVSDPLLDKRLIDICRRFEARCPQGILRIFTNGSALTEARIAELASLERLAHLWVSLNSHDPLEYERLMGLDFERTARNLDRLHASDFPHPVMLSAVGSGNEAFLRYCAKRWPKFRAFLIKQDAWIDYTTAEVAEVPDTPCTRWWELNITATGRAALCCMDGRGEHGFGDVNETTLMDLYNHPTYRAWRVGQMSRRAAGHPCAGCTY